MTLNRFLDRTTDITISEEQHGPAGARRYEYLPTFFLRGLRQLHLDFTPAALSFWRQPVRISALVDARTVGQRTQKLGSGRRRYGC